MKLIINADDFGYSRGHNLGIVDCITKGMLSSTTCLCTMEDTIHAFELAKQYPQIDLGIHLTLDLGKPICDPKEVASLIDEHGDFKHYDFHQLPTCWNLGEVEKEWRAQINKMLDYGLKPSHIDSHHHIHMEPTLFPIYVLLAKEYDLAIRFHPRKLSENERIECESLIDGLKKAEAFSSGFYDEGVTLEFFETLLELNVETVEIMSHPAYLDHKILTKSKYNMKRSLELHYFMSEELKTKLEELNIQLINFKEL